MATYNWLYNVEDPKREIERIFRAVFDGYQDEWNALKARVDAAERQADIATKSLELLKLALEAMAGIRKQEKSQFELPGIIDRE